MSLLIEFAEENNARAQAYVLSRLSSLGLEIKQDSTHPHHVQVTCTDPSLLEREADRLNMLKYNSKGFLQEFEVGIPRESFKTCNEKTGALFTASQCNFLLLSIIEQLTTDKAFIEEVQGGAAGGRARAGGEAQAQVQEGVELLEACCTLGVVQSFFPPQPEPAEHKQLWRRALTSWPGNPQGE